jgi:hypothetical protein
MLETALGNPVNGEEFTKKRIYFKLVCLSREAVESCSLIFVVSMEKTA